MGGVFSFFATPNILVMRKGRLACNFCKVGKVLAVLFFVSILCSHS